MDTINETTTNNSSSFSKMKMKMKILLCISVALLLCGDIGSPLTMRLYFIHGGKGILLSSWLMTAGWPILLIPLSFAYYSSRSSNSQRRSSIFTRGVFTFSAVVAILTALDTFFYSFGVSKLPTSTTTLMFSTQLVFNALFGYILLKNKFTPYSINSIVLLIASTGVLALNQSNDRPNGVSKKGYILGYFMTLVGSILYGLSVPLTELTYKKAKQSITYKMALEIQLIICFFANIFCTVAMLINRDFQAIPKEARNFGLGEKVYYGILIGSGINWQLYFLGAVGTIFCASSLLIGILMCFCVPVTGILGIVIYHENFKVEKGISFGLCLWGIISYFYGEFREKKKKEEKKKALAEAVTAAGVGEEIDEIVVEEHIEDLT